MTGTGRSLCVLQADGPAADSLSRRWYIWETPRWRIAVQEGADGKLHVAVLEGDPCAARRAYRGAVRRAVRAAKRAWGDA